ncbi:MAG: hypothetical protein ACKO32_11545 [Planctomycetia bacterium]
MSEESSPELERECELARRAGLRLGGLCPQCVHARGIESAKGSLFLLCGRAKEDPRYPRYPGQPVVACRGFER